MTRVSGTSRLVVVALTSILMGLLVGSGIAWAEAVTIEKRPSFRDYIATYEDCNNYECSYTQEVNAWASSAFTEFEIYRIRYYDATADDDVRFGIMHILDMRGEHSIPKYDFMCISINGANLNRAIPWYWDEHDPDAYGTEIQQHIWQAEIPCSFVEGVNRHDMLLHVE